MAFVQQLFHLVPTAAGCFRACHCRCARLVDALVPCSLVMLPDPAGSLVACEDGTVTPFGITGAQERGILFVPPRVDVYKDMIVGAYQRPGDIKVATSVHTATTPATVAIGTRRHPAYTPRLFLAVSFPVNATHLAKITSAPRHNTTMPPCTRSTCAR